MNGAVFTRAVFTSAAGTDAAGTLKDASGNALAFVWTLGSGFTTLPRVAGRGQSLTFGMSSDGTVVVGSRDECPGQGRRSYRRWTGCRSGGPPASPLQLLSTQIFASLLMTPDASSIVGNPAPNLGVSSPPVRWDQNGKPYSLLVDAPMLLFNCHPIVTQISADGRTLAGACDADGRKTGFVARL